MTLNIRMLNIALVWEICEDKSYFLATLNIVLLTYRANLHYNLELRCSAKFARHSQTAL